MFPVETADVVKLEAKVKKLKKKLEWQENATTVCLLAALFFGFLFIMSVIYIAAVK